MNIYSLRVRLQNKKSTNISRFGPTILQTKLNVYSIYYFQKVICEIIAVVVFSVKQKTIKEWMQPGLAAG